MEGSSVQRSEEQQPCKQSVLSIENQERLENKQKPAQDQEPDSGEEWDSDLEIEGIKKHIIYIWLWNR